MPGTLSFVGLGLGGKEDITVAALKAVQASDVIFLENYTSIFMSTPVEELEEFYGKKITVAYRDDVEQDDNEIVRAAETGKVSLLVVGDPFCATTHSDMYLRCREKGITVNVFHNASIMNAVAATGLQLYNFGKTISIPYWEDNWKPTSFYDKLGANISIGLHTLCLLDIKVRELTMEALCMGRKEYRPPTYMTVNEALECLMKIEDDKKEGLIKKDTVIVGVARLGYPDAHIYAGYPDQVIDHDFGGPLHCMIIVGAEVHDLELDMLKMFGFEPRE
ncbi:hypothetical protein PCE1_004078 [Barthelona sp. PCE]